MFFFFYFHNYRLRLLVYILALSGIGLLAVRSAAEQDSSLFMKQAVGVGLSLAVCLAVSLVDYHRLVRYAVPIYGICIGLLGLVLILGINHKGAVRWLKLGPVQIQPSEFVKIGMVLFFAWFLERCQDTINRPVTILKMMVLCGIPLAMVFKQPNLSTTIVITVMLLCTVVSPLSASSLSIGRSRTLARYSSVFIEGVAVPLSIWLSMLRVMKSPTTSLCVIFLARRAALRRLPSSALSIASSPLIM